MKRIFMLLATIALLSGISVIAVLSASAASCGEDAPWSEWSTTKPAASEFIKTETATFYSTRKKSTQTSTQPAISGWTQEGTPDITYGEWSAWSTTPIASVDTIEIETKSDKVGYHMTTCTFGRNSDGYRCYFPTADARSGYTRRTEQYHADWTVDQLNSAAVYNDGQWFNGPTNIYGYVLGGTGYVLGDSVPWFVAYANYGTYYRSRTVTKTYHYYKWSAWSEYAQAATAPQASSTVQVRSETRYRYKNFKHDFSEETVVTKPTCTADGAKVKVCKICGTVVTTAIPKTGHTYNSGKVTKQPTCTKTGVKTYTCTVCGHKKTKTLAKADHTYKKVTTKATLKENGSIVSKCAVCGKVASSKTVYRIKTVKLSKTSYLVNGKVQKPTVTVKNSKGKAISSKYYTVTYSDKSSKAVGTYTVTVKFKGVFEGTKTLKYKITAPAKVTGIKQFYEKGISFRWDKVSGAEGYEVYISPASESNYKKVATQTSNSLKNEKINTSVKVKVRAYVTVDGKKIYGEFSKAVTLKPVK